MQVVLRDIIANYQILGENNKNSILILHGWGRNLNDWINIAKTLSAKYKVYLLDLPGHGASSNLPFEPFDTFDHANFVIDFINKLKITRPILLGHSFGGKVSIIVATKTGLKKLILVDASGIEERNFRTRTQIFVYKRLKFLIKLLPSNIRGRIYSNLYSEAGSMVTSFKKIVIQDVDKHATKIQVPTLIIWGENDKEVTTYQAKKFHRLIKNSVLRIIWGAGHHPHLEKPEKFMNLLNEYI